MGERGHALHHSGPLKASCAAEEHYSSGGAKTGLIDRVQLLVERGLAFVNEGLARGRGSHGRVGAEGHEKFRDPFHHLLLANCTSRRILAFSEGVAQRRGNCSRDGGLKIVVVSHDYELRTLVRSPKKVFSGGQHVKRSPTSVV
jgi:hypothetical protein